MCHALLQELTAAKLLEQQQAAARKRERAERAALSEAARMEERKLLRLKAKESAADARRMHTEPLHVPRARSRWPRKQCPWPSSQLSPPPCVLLMTHLMRASMAPLLSPEAGPRARALIADRTIYAYP